MHSSKQQTIDTYNTSAAEMAVKFNKMKRTEDVARAFSFIDVVDPFVLEIGCGNGRDASEIVQYTKKYLGIDISEAMLELAKQQAPHGSFKLADVELYNFPENINLIFSFASLLHSDTKNVASVLQRAKRALHPGGVFYISLKHGEGQAVKEDEFGTRTFYFYTPERIKELAGDGYETVWDDVQEVFGRQWFTIALKKLRSD